MKKNEEEEEEEEGEIKKVWTSVNNKMSILVHWSVRSVILMLGRGGLGVGYLGTLCTIITTFL